LFSQAIRTSEPNFLEVEKLEYLVLDVETAPIEFKDQKIIGYLMDKQVDRHRHPLFSKIILIGIKKNGGEPEFFYGDDERRILIDFWDRLTKLRPPLIVTFNGYGFDVPIINVRSIVNNVKIGRSINLNKWKMMTSDHFDCMLFLSTEAGFEWVSLETSCRVLNIPIPPKRIHPSQIYDSYQEKDWNTIIEHNRQDLILTEELFKKIRPHVPFHVLL
jgi:DNA polymerase elongation subunit (family B)